MDPFEEFNIEESFKDAFHYCLLSYRNIFKGNQTQNVAASLVIEIQYQTSSLEEEKGKRSTGRNFSKQSTIVRKFDVLTVFWSKPPGICKLSMV